MPTANTDEKKGATPRKDVDTSKKAMGGLGEHNLTEHEAKIKRLEAELESGTLNEHNRAEREAKLARLRAEAAAIAVVASVLEATRMIALMLETPVLSPKPLLTPTGTASH